MRAVVCMKQVVDPLIPATELLLDQDGKKIRQAVAGPPVINGFDEQALEAALRLRESLGGLDIVGLSVGDSFNTDVMKRSLAVGADQLVLVQDPSLDTWDAGLVAATLAAAIGHLGGADLVLCGRQASDWDHAVVPLLLAQSLGLPCLTLAREVSVRGQTVQVERVLSDGFQLMSSELPAVVTVTSELGALRMPTARARLAVARVAPKVVSLADLAVAAPPPMVAMGELAIPVVGRMCRYIDATDAAAAGRELADVVWAAAGGA
ncbi:MAG: hypothetical protein WCG47_05000 [Dermatophilaceae bacterium]